MTRLAEARLDPRIIPLWEEKFDEVRGVVVLELAGSLGELEPEHVHHLAADQARFLVKAFPSSRCRSGRSGLSVSFHVGWSLLILALIE
ncbi:MAG: hypothetical protein E3J21_23735 [Anaerolineales bacterium]|nr:MAG: hypothetical protein E3J21_23735 [Anaerolineales bacterium]